METEDIEIRDLPLEALEELERRAAAEGMSLAPYLRRMIIDAAARPGLAEVLASAAQRGFPSLATRVSE